jgi:serine/threonine protein phosphatase PrpC
MIEFVVEISKASSDQDRAAVVELGDGVVIALADGAGGTGSGAAAAQAVIDALDRESVEQYLAATLESLDADLAKLGGQSTAVMIAITSDGVQGASVGDSGAWLLHRSGAEEELTARQDRKPLLGSGALPVAFTATWSKSATLLVASDGLFSYATMADIARVIREARTLADAAKQLVDLVRLFDGSLQDDVAIVLCRGEP